MVTVLKLGRNMTVVVHSAHWRLKTDWNIAIPILAG